MSFFRQGRPGKRRQQSQPLVLIGSSAPVYVGLIIPVAFAVLPWLPGRWPVGAEGIPLAAKGSAILPGYNFSYTGTAVLLAVNKMFLRSRWPFEALLIGVSSLMCFGLCMWFGYSFHLSFSMALLCSLACFITFRSLGDISLERGEMVGTDRPRGSWTLCLLVAFLHFILLAGVVASFFVPGPDIHPVFRVLVIAALAFNIWLVLVRFRPGRG